MLYTYTAAVGCRAVLTPCSLHPVTQRVLSNLRVTPSAAVGRSVNLSVVSICAQSTSVAGGGASTQSVIRFYREVFPGRGNSAPFPRT